MSDLSAPSYWSAIGAFLNALLFVGLTVTAAYGAIEAIRAGDDWMGAFQVAATLVLANRAQDAMNMPSGVKR